MWRGGGWGGRQGQHVYLGAPLFELWFVAHAKALFLVDDDGPRSLKAMSSDREAVGADDDVDGSFRASFVRFGAAGWGAETGKHLDRDGEGVQPIAEGGVMLLGQNGGGHQHGDLLAVHDRFEGCS